MNQDDCKVERALNNFSKFEDKFNELICNPEHKLAQMKGVTVLPSHAQDLRIEALGKEIEIRLNIISAGDTLLGQVTAYLIKSRDDEFISEKPLSAIWLDHLGNVKTPKPSSSGFTSTKDSNSLINFIFFTLSKILDSEECKPLENG